MAAGSNSRVNVSVATNWALKKKKKKKNELAKTAVSVVATWGFIESIVPY